MIGHVFLAALVAIAAGAPADECSKYGDRLPASVRSPSYDLKGLRAPPGAKALVTGSAGFIASHVARETMKLGFDTVCVDDMSGGFKQNIPEGCRFILGPQRIPLCLLPALSCLLHLPSPLPRFTHTHTHTHTHAYTPRHACTQTHLFPAHMPRPPLARGARDRFPSLCA